MTPLQSDDKAGIAIRTTAVILGTAVAVWLTEDRLMSRLVFSRDLSWALSAAVVFGGSLTLLTLCVSILRVRDSKAAARSRRVEPEVREAVAACLTADCGIGLAWVKNRLKKTFDESPKETADCFRQLFRTLRGDSNAKLSEIATSIGLREFWQRVYEEGKPRERAEVIQALASATGSEASRFLEQALADSDPGVRVEAARMLTRTGEGTDAENVYEFARSQSQLVKATLAEDLRPRIAVLADGVVAADLSSRDEARLRHVLEMLKAWATPVPVCLDPLLDQDDRALRLAALVLLRMIHVTDDTLSLLRLNLDNEPEEIIEAAALAAGRLRQSDLIPELTSLLSATDSGVCCAAARALSAMGQVRPLEERIRAGGSPGAEAALEAVQMAHIRHMDYARV